MSNTISKSFLTTTLFLATYSLQAYADLPHMVGGKCSYENQIAAFKIFETEKQTKGYFLAPDISSISFSIREPVNPSIYPATYSKRITGSCKPFYYTLLSTQEYSRPFFLEINEGNFNIEVDRKLQEIATAFFSVLDEWPKMTISLCGATHEKHSGSYRFNLKSRYETKTAEKLIKFGLQESQIVHERGKDCSNNMSVFSASDNGVWIKYKLNHK